MKNWIIALLIRTAFAMVGALLAPSEWRGTVFAALYLLALIGADTASLNHTGEMKL